MLAAPRRAALNLVGGRTTNVPVVPTNAHRRQYHQHANQGYSYFRQLMTMVMGSGTALAAASFLSSKKEDTAQPQQTVISATHPHCSIVVIHLKKDADVAAVARAVGNLPALVAGLCPPQDKNDPIPPLLAGVGIAGPFLDNAVKKVKGFSAPAAMVTYKERKGAHGTLPATGGDLLLHVKAETVSLCFETVKAFIESLPAGSVASFDDRYGWAFQDGRDLSGFLDGTENPSQSADRAAAALITSSEDSKHPNGSYVIHQRWVHTLPAFHKKPVQIQEQIVGRTQPESGELDPLPITSHVARTRDEKGNKIPIVRQSMPYGSFSGEHGLLFIAYANTPKKFDIMLDRMTGSGKASEANDAVMTFTKAVTGQYFYVPSTAELRSFAQA